MIENKKWRAAMFIILFIVIFLLADCAHIKRLKKEIRELKNREYDYALVRKRRNENLLHEW